MRKNYFGARELATQVDRRESFNFFLYDINKLAMDSTYTESEYERVYLCSGIWLVTCPANYPNEITTKLKSQQHVNPFTRRSA